MRAWMVLGWGLAAAGAGLRPVAAGVVAAPVAGAKCEMGVVEGELNAGQGFTQAIGNGLRVWFQPIASGWILRVVPATGPVGEHDYAELATPPYQSVTPLSVSTDFAFRAQDAVGWNPRRFHFAWSAEEFRRLEAVYRRYEAAAANPPAEVQAALAAELARTAEGTLTIEDARLVPGTADQWKMAAAVASHFSSTAHTVVSEPDGRTSALGRLVWLRFRLELALPRGFRASDGMHRTPRFCSNS